MAMITPAVSGPFDLGTVVVRVALNVNPKTAQINAVSDPIPNVFGGVKLDIRSIDLNMNRAKFMLNPTNCAARRHGRDDQRRRLATRPTRPTGAAYAVSAPVPGDRLQQARLQADASHARISGPTTRAKNPQIRASSKPRRAMPTSPARR